MLLCNDMVTVSASMFFPTTVILVQLNASDARLAPFG